MVYSHHMKLILRFEVIILVTNIRTISGNVTPFNMIEVTDISEIFTASIFSVEE
jgi:hypothetical protein